MCKKLYVLPLLALFCLPLASAQASSSAKDRIISNQELIISICQSLTECLNTSDSTLIQEVASLKAEKEGLQKEKDDFETYKTETIEYAPQLLELKKQVKKQSEQLENLNKIVSIGAPVAIAIIAVEAIALAFK